MWGDYKMNWNMMDKFQRIDFCLRHPVEMEGIVVDENWYRLSLAIQIMLRTAGITNPKIGYLFIQHDEQPPNINT